jgi:hypothetical protein
MKLAKWSIRAALLIGALAVASCGGNSQMAPPEDLKPAIILDLTTKVCISSCTTHQQCQSSCAPAPVGANCCDRLTNTCYVVATAVCPAPPADMTMTSPY